jgi:hypothetical protein
MVVGLALAPFTVIIPSLVVALNYRINPTSLTLGVGRDNRRYLYRLCAYTSKHNGTSLDVTKAQPCNDTPNPDHNY